MGSISIMPVKTVDGLAAASLTELQGFMHRVNIYSE